jgi:hypothetical protein
MGDAVREAALGADLVLVPVHARERADMCEDVLESVGELEGVNVAEPVLDVGVDDELGEAENLAAQVEGVAETGLLALLGREGPARWWLEALHVRTTSTHLTGFKFML